MLLVASLALLFTFVVWAHFAVLDEVKRGAGRVVPSRQMQVVQSLEGGIVSALEVRDGDIVQQDQVLVRIADTKFASELGEVTERRGAMTARVTRLEAAPKDLAAPDFSDDPRRTAPGAGQAATSGFAARAPQPPADHDVLT